MSISDAIADRFVTVFTYLGFGTLILWAIEVAWMIWTSKKENEHSQ